MKNHDLYELPFDQFSRQEAVAQLIDSVRKDTTSYKILDIGGHKGKTREFQYRDDVTILDVFDESYESYVKGDATKMDFDDNSFDFVCSFDVLEHIPREKRFDFFSEALRVSKLGVFIAAPVDDDHHHVSATELALNNYYKKLHSVDHQWLKEHIDYMIPTMQEVTQLLSKTSRYHLTLASNNLSDWQLLQSIIFASSKNPDMARFTQDITIRYNQNQIIPKDLPSYRKILFMASDSEIFDTVKAYSTSKDRNKKDRLPVISQQLVESIVDAFSHHITSNKNYESQLSSLEKSIDRLEGELNDVRGSSSWRLTSPLRRVSNWLSVRKKLN